MFNNSINFEEVTNESFSNLPDGTYAAVVENMGKFMWASGTKVDCSGDPDAETLDHFIELKFSIIDDKFKGRKHFENLNMWSNNEMAANIARYRFKELCLAVGIDPAKGSFDNLIDKPLKITLKSSKKPKPNGDFYVNINKISSISEVATATPAKAPILGKTKPQAVETTKKCSAADIPADYAAVAPEDEDVPI